jgi:hypothetical protein
MCVKRSSNIQEYPSKDLCLWVKNFRQENLNKIRFSHSGGVADGSSLVG